MYTQSTLFENWMPKLPGDAKVRWQGIGQDRGITLINATIDGSQNFYLVQQLQSRLTATIFDGEENWQDVQMDSNFQFPQCWWRSSRWTAFPDSYTEPTAWTVMKSRISGVHPREWGYPYLKDEDQGTTNAGDIKTRWYGDAWFDGDGLRRGVFKRWPLQEGGPVPTITLTDYSWVGNVWEHHSKGSAPAGEYVSIRSGVESRNFGFWDEEHHAYTMNPNGEYLNKVYAPMEMFSFGIVRQPLVDPTDPMPVIVPSSWDFEGANWVEPDPMDWRYWYCVRAAILERESVVNCGVDREMGLLTSDEQFLWNISPHNPIDFDTIDTMRRCIIALAKEFVDLSRVVQQLRDDSLPYKPDTCIDISYYENLMGGWSRGDPVYADSLGNLSGFLCEAKLALEEMTLAIPSRIYYHKVGPGTVCVGYAYEEQGESISDAWRDAMGEYDDYEVEWEHWTKSRSEALSPVWWAVNSSISGRCGDEVDNQSNHSYIAAFNWWSEALQSVCYPPSSVIDGLPWATPTVFYVREAKKPDVEVGDSYYGGIVTRVSFYSGMGISEGIRTGQMQFPLESIESPPSGAPIPGTSQGAYVTGWHVWGNSTAWWFYVYFGASFRFGGPPPEVDEVPEEEEEEEPQPSPQPEPSPVPQAIPGPPFKIDDRFPLSPESSDEPSYYIKTSTSSTGRRDAEPSSAERRSYKSKSYSWATWEPLETYTDEDGAMRLKPKPRKLRRYIKAKIIGLGDREYCLVPDGEHWNVSDNGSWAFKAWYYSEKPPKVDKLGRYYWRDCIPGKAVPIDPSWTPPSPYDENQLPPWVEI